MDWILFVFKRSGKTYLVASESEEWAWSMLCDRQSVRLEICKREYKLIGTMNGNGGVWKIS